MVHRKNRIYQFLNYFRKNYNGHHGDAVLRVSRHWLGVFFCQGVQENIFSKKLGGRTVFGTLGVILLGP